MLPNFYLKYDQSLLFKVIILEIRKKLSVFWIRDSKICLQYLCIRINITILNCLLCSEQHNKGMI